MTGMANFMSRARVPALSPVSPSVCLFPVTGFTSACCVCHQRGQCMPHCSAGDCCAGKKGKKEKKKGKAAAAEEEEDLDALLAELDGSSPAQPAAAPEPASAPASAGKKDKKKKKGKGGAAKEEEEEVGGKGSCRLCGSATCGCAEHGGCLPARLSNAGGQSADFVHPALGAGSRCAAG